MELIINELANKDHFTNDRQYNAGLKLIKEYGYLYVCGNPDVKYYCMCNGFKKKGMKENEGSNMKWKQHIAGPL